MSQKITHPYYEGRPLLLGDKLVCKTDEWGSGIESGQEVTRFSDEDHVYHVTVKQIIWENNDEWLVLDQDSDEYPLREDGSDFSEEYAILHRDHPDSKAWWSTYERAQQAVEAVVHNSNQPEPFSGEKRIALDEVPYRPTCELCASPRLATARINVRRKATGTLMHDSNVCADHHLHEARRVRPDEELTVIQTYGD